MRWISVLSMLLWPLKVEKKLGISGLVSAYSSRTLAHRSKLHTLGYLACTLFLKNDNELGIMLMNTLQRDLKSQNYLDRCAALNAICYLHHAELASSVLDLVVQTMDFPK